MLPAVLCLWSIAPLAFADEVDGIFCRQTEPLVVRGGVIMLELQAERPGDSWPREITIRFEQSGTVEGAVIWRYAEAEPLRVHWTTPPIALTVREIMPEDDSSSGYGTPLLIARVPENAGGTVRLLDQRLNPVWMELSADALREIAPANPGGEILELFAAPDRPDPSSPFEYWRWVLLAARLGLEAPAPAGTEVEQMVAQYQADLWRAALARLAQANVGAARECLSALTSIASDGELRFAAWMTDSADLYSLLSMLLDFELGGPRLAQRILDWLDTREHLFFWPGGSDGEALSFAFANGGTDARVVSLRWRFGDRGGGRDAAEIPTALDVPAGTLRRVRIPRPQIPEDASSATPPTLVMESSGFRREVPLRPAVLPVRPPGLNLGALQPVLTLIEARAQSLAPPSPVSACYASFRRADGRWEVFFECLRPLRSNEPPPPDDSQILEGLNDVRDTRGLEAVTILIGPANAPTVSLTVPETGWHRIWIGAPSDSLQIHRRSYEDRWYCRIVLPDEWLDFPLAPTAEIGFLRTHGGSSALETSPNITLPWSLDPGRIEVDLHSWEDLPPSR